MVVPWQRSGLTCVQRVFFFSILLSIVGIALLPVESPEVDAPVFPWNKTNPCPTQNSPWWKRRHKNVDDGTRLVPDTEDYLEYILNQSICSQASPLRQFANTSNTRQQWVTRLLYLGIHLHQHDVARHERQERASCAYNSSHATNDYECKGSKFLVSALSGVGMGASMRQGGVTMLLTALAMNRTMIFLNGAPKYLSAEYITEHWRLSGCRRRGDYQCYFLPMTPCVPSMEELQHATELTYNDRQDIQVQGKLNASLNSERVILLPAGMDSPTMDAAAKLRIGQRLYQVIHAAVQEQRVRLPRWIQVQLPSLLLDPANWEFQPTERQQGVQHAQGTSLLHAVGLLYLLRPNQQFRERSNAMLAAVPNDFVPQHSVGLAIRASDKCVQESVCLLFDEYMQLVLEHHKRLVNATNVPRTFDLVLSTESPNMMASRHAWPTNASFPFRFVVNEADILQGSGYPRHFQRRAYKVMLSSVVAIQMQLQSQHFLGNCCSSFHNVILDLFKIGCGNHPWPTFFCLQELPDDNYHLCCMWDSSARCRQQRQEYQHRMHIIGEEKFF